MIDKPISYGRQYISDEDIQAVVDTLKGDYLTCGADCREYCWYLRICTAKPGSG